MSLERITFYLVIFLVLIPLGVLLHELGHATLALVFSRKSVAVFVGTKDETSRISIGRLSLHLRPGFWGLCRVDQQGDIPLRRRAAISLGGRWYL